MPDSSHPFFFTWTAQRDARPLEMTGGQGAYFTSTDGERWLDFGSMSYQASLGHGHPRMVEAIKRQADSLCVGLPSAVYPAKTELAERLLALAPDGFTKVFFTTGGAEAVENAIKMARLATGRQKLVSRYRSYHGATMGALSLTGDWRRPPLEPALPGVVHAQDCYCDRCSFGQRVESCARECASHIDEILDLEGAGTVAAVVLESVPGANGVLVPPDDYWPMVREACDRDGALLVADEVLTGFGRTGRCFGFEHWDAMPDIITLAKALTAGYAPLGAVLVHERVAAQFDDNVLVAGLTNYAHPLGCAAGVEALAIYEDEQLFDRSASLGPVLRARVATLRDRYPEQVTHVRGLGLLVAVELDLDAAEWALLAAAIRARKLHLHVDARRGTVIFSPPLNITDAELDLGVSLFEEALGATFEKGPQA